MKSKNINKFINSTECVQLIRFLKTKPQVNETLLPGPPIFYFLPSEIDTKTGNIYISISHSYSLSSLFSSLALNLMINVHNCFEGLSSY